jgi:hypothetical protein
MKYIKIYKRAFSAVCSFSRQSSQDFLCETSCTQNTLFMSACINIMLANVVCNSRSVLFGCRSVLWFWRIQTPFPYDAILASFFAVDCSTGLPSFPRLYCIAAYDSVVCYMHHCVYVWLFASAVIFLSLSLSTSFRGSEHATYLWRSAVPE